MKGDAYTKTKLMPCHECGTMVERDARLKKATCLTCKEKAVHSKRGAAKPDATMKAWITDGR